MKDFSTEIKNSLDVLFKLDEKKAKKKTLLDKGPTVFLQIVLFKIPYVFSPRRKCLKLCHSLYGDDPDICLFVPNRKTGVEYKKTTDELIDFCVEHYTDLLEKHKVKGIKTVMPVKQLRAEYGTYELRRKLANRYDLFLCKNSLLFNPRFLSGLGKFFAHKFPLGIPFPKTDEYDPEFEKNIKRAVFTTSFYIKPFSDNYSIPIGSLSNSKSELEDNLKAVLNQILSENVIPGGFRNIRAINIWPSQSKNIPLYISPDLPSDLRKPRIKSTRRGVKVVTGEISSLPNQRVTVLPSGRVIILGPRAQKDEYFEDDIPLDERSEDDEEDEWEKEKVKVNKAKGLANEDESESESEDDEKIEEQERKLLTMKRQVEAETKRMSKRLRKTDEEKTEEDEDDADDNEDENDEIDNKELQNNRKKRRIFTKKETGKVIIKNKKKASKEKGNAKAKANANNKGKVKKATRKLVIKQEKFKLAEKNNQKKLNKTKSNRS